MNCETKYKWCSWTINKCNDDCVVSGIPSQGSCMYCPYDLTMDEWFKERDKSRNNNE